MFNVSAILQKHSIPRCSLFCTYLFTTL